MRKSTKIWLGVMGALALIDLSDIAGKGHMLCGVRAIDEDVYEEMSEKIVGVWDGPGLLNKAGKFRAGLIVKCADELEDIL